MAVRSSRLEAPRATLAPAVAWLRPATAFVVVLGGMLVVGDVYDDDSLCWLLWLAIGILSGAIAGSVRHLWVVIAAMLAFYPIAAWQGIPDSKVEDLHWNVLMLVGATIVAGGFAIGAVVVSRTSRARTTDRWIALAAVALALVAFAGWAVFAGVLGSDDLMALGKDRPARACFTPDTRYGWRYEAINYDIADDLALPASNPDLDECVTQRAGAGDVVVASDGIRLAGWYIPAASDIGPTGPTLLIIPGHRETKSELLKYAPPFHDTFNLVLIDLRNVGRSDRVEHGASTVDDRAATTMGYRETRDVKAMIDWLVATKHPSWIGAVGDSMGAATALAEAGDDPRIQALILDSMHGSVATTLAKAAEVDHYVPGYPAAWAVVAITSLRIGADLTSIDPEQTITRLGDRPVLLIHGGKDRVDVPATSAERVFALGQAAGVPIELHICPPGQHGAVIDACPTAWTIWAREFLDRVGP